MKDNIIVTISRQYGSGGRYIGKLVAAKLGIPVYDKAIIGMTAEKCGFSKDFVNQVEEKPTNRLFYAMQTGNEFFGGLSMNDKIFIEQSNLLKELAGKGSAVIVGRAANYVLENFPNVFNVFIYTDMEHRVKRAVTHYGLNEDEAKKAIKRSDKSRKAYHKDYAGQTWGAAENYHLLLDSDKLGVENAADLIVNALEML